MDSKSPLREKHPGVYKSVVEEWIGIRWCFEYNKSEQEMVLKVGDSPPIFQVRNCKEEEEG